MGVVAQALSTTEGAVPPAIRLARLSGPVEVPPGDPDGSGLATFIIDPARSQLCFSIVVDDILLPAILAHIHVAPAGVAGPIVVPLAAPDANGDLCRMHRRDRPTASEGDQEPPTPVLRERPHDRLPRRRGQRTAPPTLNPACHTSSAGPAAGVASAAASPSLLVRSFLSA